MKILILILLMGFQLGISAQILPIEKVFIASDRLDYNDGDSILLEGKLMTGDTLKTTYSRYVYVELFNAKDSLINRQKLICETNGDFTSKMQVDYGLQKGYYYLRAYTKLMQNFPDETYPVVPIRIGLTSQQQQAVSKEDLFCKFFPEGGHLGMGEAQNVAIHLHNQNYRPVSEPYVIVNIDGDTIQQQKTTPGGWQIVSFTPVKGMNYYLKTRHNGQDYTFILPEKHQSPLIQTILNRSRLYYKVLQPDSSIENGKIYLYCSYVGLLELPFNKEKMGMVDLSGMDNGTITLLLANNNGKIISHVTQWHGTESLEGNTPQWKTSYAPGESLELPDILLPNDSASSFFVRILPEEQTLSIPQAETALLLENDFTSNIPVPVRYATPNKIERETDWRGWLLSARLTRFDVASLVKNGFNYKHQPEKALTLSGEITGNPGEYPLENGSVTIMNQDNGYTYRTELDENGKFTITIDDYRDKCTFFVQGRDRKNKDGEYNYTFGNDTLPEINNHRKVRLDEELSTEFGTSHGQYSIDGNNLMPEVIVKGRVRQEMHESTERFYGIRFIGKEALQKRNYQNFEQMLTYFHGFIFTMRDDNPDAGGENARRGRQAGGAHAFDDQEPWAPLVIYSRRSSVLKPKPLPVLVDGSRWTAEEANNLLEMRNVEYIELLTPNKAQLVVPGAIDGAIVIRTKKWEKEIVNSKGIFYTPPLGIANMDFEHQDNRTFKVPDLPGKYQLLVDIVKADKTVLSYRIPIEVED